MSVVTRFPPSPTGALHIGSVRVALFNFLFARHHGGKFILRMEDTDRERSTQASIDAILQGMAWLGLDYDEGPYYQTQRFDRYHNVANQLLDSGHAYRCYCSKERLETLREQQIKAKQKPRYDGLCREREPTEPNQPFVIRFKNPRSGEVIVDDQVYGEIVFKNHELDDLIIARTDGTPTYNLTVVVDDWDMRVTHVIRGDDHINNTPRQINILRALDAELPVYAHLPMILGPDGKRLSKRHGAVNVMSYKEQGLLPEAVLNYLVRLGWSHGDQEIFSLAEMINLFDLTAINKAPASINPDKLLWLNQHYLKSLDRGYVAEQLHDALVAKGIKPTDQPSLTDVVASLCERSKTLVEMADRSAFLYQEVAEYDQAAIAKHIKPEAKAVLQLLLERFADVTDWNMQTVHQVITDLCEQQQLGMGKVAQPIRIAVTGSTVSPPIDATLYLLGKDKTVARLQAFVNYLG